LKASLSFAFSFFMSKRPLFFGSGGPKDSEREADSALNADEARVCADGV
jgi:hypothetical protein